MSRWVRRTVYVVSMLTGLLILAFGYREFGLGLKFHIYAGLAMLSFLAAPAAIFHMDNRRKSAIDRSLPMLLNDLTEGQEAGMRADYEGSERVKAEHIRLANASIPKGANGALYPEDLSDIHAQTLLLAILEALKKQGIRHRRGRALPREPLARP